MILQGFMSAIKAVVDNCYTDTQVLRGRLTAARAADLDNLDEVTAARMARLDVAVSSVGIKNVQVRSGTLIYTDASVDASALTAVDLNKTVVIAYGYAADRAFPGSVIPKLTSTTNLRILAAVSLSASQSIEYHAYVVEFN